MGLFTVFCIHLAVGLTAIGLFCVLCIAVNEAVTRYIQERKKSC